MSDPPATIDADSQVPNIDRLTPPPQGMPQQPPRIAPGRFCFARTAGADHGRGGFTVYGMTGPPFHPEDLPPAEEPSRIPLSRPPQRSANWWKTIPGQLAIIAVALGLLVILCQLTGIIDFRGGPDY